MWFGSSGSNQNSEGYENGLRPGWITYFVSVHRFPRVDRRSQITDHSVVIVSGLRMATGIHVLVHHPMCYPYVLGQLSNSKPFRCLSPTQNPGWAWTWTPKSLLVALVFPSRLTLKSENQDKIRRDQTLIVSYNPPRHTLNSNSNKLHIPRNYRQSAVRKSGERQWCSRPVCTQRLRICRPVHCRDLYWIVAGMSRSTILCPIYSTVIHG